MDRYNRLLTMTDGIGTISYGYHAVTNKRRGKMNYKSSDYTFLGLLNEGKPLDTPITSIAYLASLVDGPQNPVLHLDKAKFILRYLFDVEEQVKTASELVAVQEESFPRGFFPQTPVMLTLRWSPISELLEHGWTPSALNRESKRRACASGIWKTKTIEKVKPREECKTPDELFWHILNKVSEKARSRRLLISIIAMPGWSYKSNIDSPQNLTIAEAEKADRVIWQRTPR